MIVRSSRKITYDVAATVENAVNVLYTCPANCRAEMSLLFVVNSNGNTSVTVRWHRAKTDHTVNIVGGKNMVGGEYIQFDGAVIVCEPGDRMEVIATGNASPHIDALCTVEEIFIPIG